MGRKNKNVDNQHTNTERHTANITEQKYSNSQAFVIYLSFVDLLKNDVPVAKEQIPVETIIF